MPSGLGPFESSAQPFKKKNLTWLLDYFKYSLYNLILKKKNRSGYVYRRKGESILFGDW